MSHLTSDNKHIIPTGDKSESFNLKPMNSLVPPQEEQATVSTDSKPLAQKGAEFLRDQASRLPLDLHSDADPARDKALSDSVRAGVVDDVGMEEGRRIVNDKVV